MSRFLKLEKLDPYRLLGSVLRRSRSGMQTAFDAAFESHARCTELLEEYRWSRMSTNAIFNQFGYEREGARTRRPSIDEATLERTYAEAQSEDLQADYQASIVVLFADDALQRFAKGVVGNAPGLDPGYGKECGTHRGSVKLTTLLRAGSNAIRHVSEWDDYPWMVEGGAVYPTLEAAKPGRERQAMESIVVFQKALGHGVTERIRDVQSMNIVIHVDGHLGTPNDGPQYARFEAAVIDAAREIAAHIGGDAPLRLSEELQL